MRVALDTHRITDLFRGDLELAEQLGTGTQQRRNEGLLNRLLANPTIGVLLPSRETAEHYERIFVQLRRAGTPVPDNDLWIAAQALEHDLVLITRDRHFERIPQVIRA